MHPRHVAELFEDALKAEALVAGDGDVVHLVVLQDYKGRYYGAGVLTSLLGADDLLQVIQRDGLEWRQEGVGLDGEEVPALLLALVLGGELLGVHLDIDIARVDHIKSDGK